MVFHLFFHLLIFYLFLAINAKHYKNETEFNYHNLNGILQIYHTYNNLLEYTNLPIIITRNTFPGSGRFSGHWSGDNEATWEYLRLSIPSLFNFNLFGIPFTGSDICGFYGNTTEQLCARWIQIGILYPFSRNHNHEGHRLQEFHLLGPTVLETAKINLEFRYSILKYFYMLFLKSKNIGTIIKPLFFEFPKEAFLYKDEIIDTHFLLGKDILCIPILFNNSNSTLGFFPSETWYSLKTGFKFHKKENKHNFYLIYNNLNDTMPLFLRQGAIFHFQNTKNLNNSNDLDNIFDLIIALKEVKKNNKNNILNFLNEKKNKRNSQINYRAKGNIIGISVLSEKNVFNKCVKGLNCLYIIKFEMLCNLKYFFFRLKFSKNKLEKNIIFEETIFIKNIKLLGLSQKGIFFEKNELIKINCYVSRNGVKIKKIIRETEHFYEKKYFTYNVELKNLNLRIKEELEFSCSY